MKEREFQNLKPGDIVLVHYRNKYYAKVTNVEERYYDQEDVDDHLRYTERWGHVVEGVCKCGNDYCPKVGARYGDLVTVEKIYNDDFSPSKRQTIKTYDEAWMTKVTRQSLMEYYERFKNFSGVV